MNIDGASERALLVLARSAIAESLGAPHAAVDAGLPVLERRQGAFVTLTLRGRLRGCIGRVESTAPLRILLPEVARAAAFSDPRFPPLAAEELEPVRVEISLLSAPVRVASVESVVAGRHGVIVEMESRRGLLLPQVALERGWDREELLAHACAKASLPPQAWRRDGVSILTFEAHVFSE